MRSVHIAILLLAVFVALLYPVQGMRSHEGLCPCPRIYMPVCGTDLKTYSNNCLLRCSAESPRGRAMKLRQLREGTCEEIHEMEDLPDDVNE